MISSNDIKQPSAGRFYLPVILLLLAVVMSLLNYFSFLLIKKMNTEMIILNVMIAIVYMMLTVYQMGKHKFVSYIKSLFTTTGIRNVLVIPKEVSSLSGKDKINRVNNLYNSALWSTYVEYVGRKLYVNVKIPKNLEAAALLDKKLSKLRETIASDNTDYSFSSFERVGQYYISVGIK